MSLLWKQGAFVLKNLVTGLVYKCRCCPCYEWGIGLVCEYPCGDAPAENKITSITINNVGAHKAMDIAIFSGTPIGSIACASFNAPYDGSAVFETFINGVGSGTSTISMTSGASVVYSTTFFDNDILEDGAHKIEIKATLTETATSDEEDLYRHACLLVYDAGTLESPDCAVMPYALYETSGAVVAVGHGGVSDAFKFGLMFGPYNTKIDAEYVYTNWGGLIREWNKTCHCIWECGPGDDAMYASWVNNILYESTGLTDWACEVAMEWEIDSNFYGTGSVELESEAGLILWDNTDGSTTITIPACTKVGFNFGIQGCTGEWQVNIYSTDGQATICCIDEVGGTYEDAVITYSYSTGEGIPNTSDDLADYLENWEV